MYKDRGDGRGGSRESIDAKKRIEETLERTSPSTSKGNAREKDRVSMVPASTGRRLGSVDLRPTFDKTKYADDGKLLASMIMLVNI
ncbi:hypothetical protein GOP47_0009627 [Adiantum capillus-veneris]|uniref:Uncharacterized protein n=1 Tax=Adiantum capillus-veneris TaxID=13818 RepID=A0A9D4ZJN9_ADICA|nr:hypothetical protein GOP47_0009627 [Adiantum capillus-veneris]